MIDWGDLKLNGMPAVQRALEALDKRQSQQETQMKLLAYQVSQPEGLLPALELLQAALARQVDRITELEYLWSEEIMRQSLSADATEPATPSEPAGKTGEDVEDDWLNPDRNPYLLEQPEMQRLLRSQNRY